MDPDAVELARFTIDAHDSTEAGFILVLACNPASMVVRRLLPHSPRAGEIVRRVCPTGYLVRRLYPDRTGFDSPIYSDLGAAMVDALDRAGLLGSLVPLMAEAAGTLDELRRQRPTVTPWEARP